MTVHTSPGPTPTRPSATSKSLELQGLRAVAVGLVVCFHLWPQAISGGYVGVDVFFVISGYLITQHLAREVHSTGTVRVTRFWARRIRRLLPAALLVLALSGLAVMVWFPSTMWANSAHHIAASALYVENWALASESVDYMAQDNVPTVAQHYWSLSVEEQFYFAWPLIIVAVVAAAARARKPVRGRRRRLPTNRQQTQPTLLGVLVLVSLASLAWSVLSTPGDQALAYLSSLTRVWEFGIGAIAALVAWRPGASAARLLGWAGVAAITVSGLTFTERSAFPGWIALLPVLGSLAVIISGLGGRSTAGWWLARKPLTVIGDLSYSIYLVHWPLIVITPMALGSELDNQTKLAILGATVVLAQLSKTYVEDPCRESAFLAGRSWRTFGFAVLGMAVLVGSNLAWRFELDRREAVATAAAEELLEANGRCLGPQALDPRQGCPSVTGTGQLASPPEVVVQQGYLPLFQECHAAMFEETLLGCELGDLTNPTRTVALVGDSHAASLMPLMDALGEAQGWRVVAHPKTSCPLTLARRVLADSETDTDVAESCERFNAEVIASLVDDPEVTDVFFSSFTSAYTWTSMPGQSLPQPETDGFTSIYRLMIDAGKRVHVFRDVPRTNGKSVPDCLAKGNSGPIRCASPRTDALPLDNAVRAAEAMNDPRVRVIDLTDSFCDESICHVRIGDVIVYRDSSHLSMEYSRLLAPYVLEQLARGN